MEDDDPETGQSIEDRAANGEGQDADAEDQGELFPLGSVTGDAKSLKSIIKAGLAVEQTVSLGTAEVPISSGGLLDPDREGMVLVTFEVAGYQPVPVREGERVTGKRIKKWKIRTLLRPIHVERIDGERGVLIANFAALLNADETEAGATLDELTQLYKAKLASGKHPSRVKAGAGAPA